MGTIKKGAGRAAALIALCLGLVVALTAAYSVSNSQFILADNPNTTCSAMGATGGVGAQWPWSDSHGSHTLQACTGYGNSAYGDANPFQCEELIQRYANMRWSDPAPAASWTPGTGWGVNADRVWPVHPSHFSALFNGSTTAPQPGDILLFGPLSTDPGTLNTIPTSPYDSAFNAYAGHIAVITSVTSSFNGLPTVTIIEQNYNAAGIGITNQLYYIASRGVYTIENDVKWAGYQDSRAQTYGYWTRGIHSDGSPLTDQVIYGWLHAPTAPATLGTTARWVGKLASNGALMAFKVDTTGNVAYSYESAPGSTTWSAWGQLPNPSQQTFVGNPAVATNSDGRLFVFARSTSGVVWLSTQSSTSSATSCNNWSNFSNPSGVTMASDPAVAASNNGELFLFVRDTGGVIREQNQTTPGGAWLSSGYSQFSNPAGVTMAGNPTAVLGGDNKLYLFVRDTGGVIRLQNQTSPDGPWLSSGFTHFTNPSGVTMAGDPTAAPGGDGRLYLFVRDTGGVVRLQEQSGPGGAWMSSGYSQFSNPAGVTMAGNPTVIRSNSGDLYLFVRETGGVIREQNQTGPNGAWLSSGFSQYSNPSGVTMSDDPAAGVDSAGTLQLFDVGSDSHMYWAYQPTGSGWHVLTSIGGSLV